MTPSRIRARHCCRSNFMGTDRIEHIGKNVGRLTRVGAGQRLLHGVQTRTTSSNRQDLSRPAALV